MATTTNYGWTTPDDTALVKDGASAIRTLGSSIDTSLNTALGTKKAGLVLLNTTSFSGVTSQSINDCFSATYDNYQILIDGVNSTTSAQLLTLRMRASGSDNSSSNYRWSMNYQRDNSATPTVTGEGSNGTSTSFNLGGLSSTAGYYSPMTIELKNPFSSTKQTGYNFANYYYDQFGTLGYSFTGSGAMTVTTSYTGFTFICSNNMTGSVSVYGYNK